MSNLLTEVLFTPMSCTLIANQSLCSPKRLLEFHQGISPENSYESLKIKVAKIINVTNCCICSQIMLGGTGFLRMVHPYGLATTLLMGSDF